ncbi:MAG TPA: hypothetical protein VIW92_03010 [Thermoanaerobaculia bacterium]
MRTACLIFASAFFAFLFGGLPAQAQWCHDIDQTYWCGDPSDCEGVCTQPGSDCTTACSRFGNWTTCGGGSETDSDSDGIPNTSDNCLCSSNSNQADCDQDGMGDVCDAVDEKWVPVSSVTYCDWDMDWQGPGWGEVELYGTQRYRELCTNAYCNNSVKMDDKKCYGYTQADDCCYDNFRYLCDTDNQCPAETCPF